MIAKQRYPWVRWWLGSQDRPSLPGDGFFPDPESEYAWLGETTKPQRLQDLTEVPCLLLLGEPGLGKTEAIKDEVARLQAGKIGPVKRIPLGAYGEPATLRPKIFESQWWASWLDSNQTLHLFLDGLDEALLQGKFVHQMLAEEFDVADALHRLRLRVVCRSAEWMPELGQQLRELWSGVSGRDDSVVELSLARLRAADAASAAAAEGLDPDQFLGQVHDRDLDHLAALPLTLTMLIAAAGQGRGLPESRADLLNDGCHQLASEHGDVRERLALKQGLSPSQKVAVAKRIAAALLLSGRNAVRVSTGAGTPFDVVLDSIAGFDERDRAIPDQASFAVGRNEITETLESALFVSVGSGRTTFVHRGLAEYLAGAYLAEHHLGVETLVQLLVASDDTEGGLVPQLREVAAWIAAFDRAAFADLIAREPDVLLRVERLELAQADRAAVVEALLDIEPAERIERWDRRIWHNLAGLSHPGLADQLSAVISDADAHWSVRQLAITLARVCEVEACQPVLLGLALDPREPVHTRDDAVWALKEYGSPTIKRKLIPLACEFVEHDSDDEIKGQALQAVYPDLISTESMLAALTEPRNTHFFGAYSHFRLDLPKQIPADDLPVAVEWATTVDTDRHGVRSLDDVADAILARAWSQLGDGRLADLLAAALLERLRKHERLVAERGDFEPDAVARRAVLERLIVYIHADDLHPRWLAATRPQLAHVDDLDWLMDRLEAASGSEVEANWAGLIEAAFVPGHLSERLYDLSSTNGELDEQMQRWFAPVPIDSEDARWWREHAAPDESPDIAETIDADLEAELSKAEAGDTDGWWHFIWQLLFDRRGQGRAEIEPDLTQFPGWTRLSDAQRLRALEVARAYLHDADPFTDEWWGTNRGDRRAWAGYQALCLLHKLDERRFQELSAEVWTRWMPIVIAYPRAVGMAEETEHDRILKAAHDKAPTAFEHWLVEKLRSEADGGDHLWTLRLLGKTESDFGTDRLRSELDIAVLPPAALRDFLDYCLARDPEPTIALVIEEFERNHDPDRAEVMLAALITNVADLAWDQMWVYFDQQPQLGVAAVERALYDEHADFAQVLDDHKLGQLVPWLFANVPPSKDPPHEMQFHNISSREYLRDVRNRLLQVLASRGSDAAVDSIQAMHEADPSDQMRFALRAAKEARRRRWSAPEPAQVVALIKSHGKASLILSAQHLQAAALGALARIQDKIAAGQPALAPQLWDQGPMKPMNEERISDWVADRLQTELAESNVVGREVQVSPSASGRGRPKSTDLQIWAPLAGGESKVTVMVEVKGCWNRELTTAMETQLVDRYLRPAGLRHGIYLVFWFDPAGWEETGPTRGWAFDDLETMNTALGQQAQELSASGALSVSCVVLDGSRRTRAHT